MDRAGSQPTVVDQRRQLARQDDLSVVATGANGKTTYQFAARTDQANITGVRLEVLAQDSLPGKGPGRAANGNFVLTEFRAEWAPDSDPAQKTAVVLQNAQADFSQQGYEVATAIDGQKGGDEQWLGDGAEDRRKPHRGVRDRDNVGGSPGVLTCFLDQEFADGTHTIGRFRISVTTAERPVTLDGLPKNITDLLAVKGDQRSDQQKAELLAYYRGADGELKKREQAAAEARKPRVIDPQLQIAARCAGRSQPAAARRPETGAAAARRRAEHAPTAERATYLRPGPRLGADQQPRVSVQPIDLDDRA